HRDQVIDVASGAIVYSGIPWGSYSFDRGFDPVDPHVLYYAKGSSLHQVTLGASGTFTDNIYFTAPDGASIGSLGGTLNWLDANGGFRLVRYGAEPSVYVYDRQNLQAGPFANPINAAPYIDSGSYIGITPDGKYLVGYDSSKPMSGSYGLGQAVSWAIN